MSCTSGAIIWLGPIRETHGPRVRLVPEEYTADQIEFFNGGGRK